MFWRPFCLLHPQPFLFYILLPVALTSASMCFCRHCWRTLSTLGWGIRESEARPMTTCWMNLWRLCRTGKITSSLNLSFAHFLYVVCYCHHNRDRRPCSLKTDVEQFSTVSSCSVMQPKLVGFRGLELKSLVIQFLLLWTKFWLLSNINQTLLTGLMTLTYWKVIR